jgi:hypothetical protein
MMNYQEAQKKQQQQQKIAMAIMQEQRMRERNWLTARNQQASRAAQQRRYDETDRGREADARNSAIWKAGMADPKNRETYLRQFTGTPAEINAFDLSMNRAAEKYNEADAAKSYRENTNLFQSSKAAVGRGDYQTFGEYGITKGQLRPWQETELLGAARNRDRIAEHNARTGKANVGVMSRAEANMLSPDFRLSTRAQKLFKDEGGDWTAAQKMAFRRDKKNYDVRDRAKVEKAVKAFDTAYQSSFAPGGYPTVTKNSSGEWVAIWEKGRTENGVVVPEGHRWEDDLFQSAPEPDEPNPLVQGAPRPSMPTRPGMTQQREPRWQAAYDRLVPDPDLVSAFGYSGELDDRKWSEAKIPYPKWPEEVKEAKRERQAARRQEVESFLEENRTDEQRAIIKQREEREQAWADKVASGKERRKDEEIFSRWDGGDPTSEWAQEAYTTQELQRVEASQVAEQAQAWFDSDRADGYSRAKEAAELALNIDPNNQEAANILGMIQEFGAGGIGSRTPGVPQYAGNEPTPLDAGVTDDWVAPSQFFDSTNALTADVTQTGTNVSQTAVDQAGTNALPATVTNLPPAVVTQTETNVPPAGVAPRDTTGLLGVTPQVWARLAGSAAVKIAEEYAEEHPGEDPMNEGTAMILAIKRLKRTHYPIRN